MHHAAACALLLRSRSQTRPVKLVGQSHAGSSEHRLNSRHECQWHRSATGAVHWNSITGIALVESRHSPITKIAGRSGKKADRAPRLAAVIATCLNHLLSRSKRLIEWSKATVLPIEMPVLSTNRETPPGGIEGARKQPFSTGRLDRSSARAPVSDSQMNVFPCSFCSIREVDRASHLRRRDEVSCPCSG